MERPSYVSVGKVQLGGWILEIGGLHAFARQKRQIGRERVHFVGRRAIRFDERFINAERGLVQGVPEQSPVTEGVDVLMALVDKLAHATPADVPNRAVDHYRFVLKIFGVHIKAVSSAGVRDPADLNLNVRPGVDNVEFIGRGDQLLDAHRLVVQLELVRTQRTRHAFELLLLLIEFRGKFGGLIVHVWLVRLIAVLSRLDCRHRW
mmetsp:Transcript_44245/g.99998  ORF Transcript_44245/g.99998 Transcript_44245/m.99998 type:complete len:206 (-) Transcript_44245:152-769(-)